MLASPALRCAMASTLAERAAASRPARSQYPIAFSGSPASLKWPATRSGCASSIWAKRVSMALRYAGVQCLPALSEQAFISGVSHQCVLEYVGGCRGNAAAEDKLRGDESIERCLKLGLRQRNDGGKQFVIELPADAGADLRNLFHHWCEAVEARHQRIVQGGWNSQRRQRPGEDVAVSDVAEQSGFEHGFGELLREERHALRARQNLLKHFGGQRLASSDPLDQRPGLCLRQAVQREQRHVRKADPRRRELRPERRRQGAPAGAEGDRRSDRRAPAMSDRASAHLPAP